VVIIDAADAPTSPPGIHVFTMRDIDERGIRSLMEEALYKS